LELVERLRSPCACLAAMLVAGGGRETENRRAQPQLFRDLHKISSFQRLGPKTIFRLIFSEPTEIWCNVDFNL
jgi:hypothetical protein